MTQQGIGRFLSWKVFSRNRKTAQLLKVASTLRKWGQKDRELIGALLAAGANANARDAWGKSAMDYAQRADNKWVMKLLLEHGADPVEKKNSAATEQVEPEPIRVVNDVEDGADDLVSRLTFFPLGFVEKSDDPIMGELAIGNLFAVQCAVQMALSSLGKREQADDLLKAIGVRFGTGLADPIVMQVAQNLPKYAESFDALRESGVGTVEATVSSIATTFDSFLGQRGGTEDTSLQLVALMTQSCTEAIKATMTFIDEHFQSEPEQSTDANKASEEASLDDWLGERLRNSSASDTERVELILRHAQGAREFLRIATENGFSVQSEDSFGLKLAGPNSVLIFTVLSSKGANEIFTLSIKEGTQAVETLVNEGKLRPKKVMLRLDENESAQPKIEAPRVCSTEGTNPLRLAVLANDIEAVRIFLEAGWGTSAENENVSLVSLAEENGYDNVATLIKEWSPK